MAGKENVEKKDSNNSPVETLVSLFAQLQKHNSSVQIQKLASTTAIADCNKSLWLLTGHLTEPDRNPHDRPRPMIRDLGYCVWRCRIGTKHLNSWLYGKSITESICKALED